MNELFCDIVADPLGFPMQLSISLYLLPALCGRCGSNVHVTGFARTSIVRLWSKDINITDVIFLHVRHWNDKTTRQEYKQRHFYIFKMMDKTGSSNRSSSRAHTQTHTAEQIWSKYYCNSSAVNKVIDYAKLKESVHKCLRRWRITGNSNVAIQTGSVYISDSITDITAIPTANLEFLTTPGQKKLTPGNCDDDRQPEMAMWPPNRKSKYKTVFTIN